MPFAGLAMKRPNPVATNGTACRLQDLRAVRLSEGYPAMLSRRVLSQGMAGAGAGLQYQSSMLLPRAAPARCGVTALAGVA